MTRLIAGTLLALCALNVSSYAADIDLEILPKICNDEEYDSESISERVLARLKSLCGVWYPYSELPVPSPPDELATACNQFFGTSVDDFVNEYLLDEPLLCWYAALDQDQDGIRDFRVSSSGFFSENDTDVDNDKIPNRRDVTVLTKDDEGIPPNGCENSQLPILFDWNEITHAEEYKFANTKDCSGADHQLCAIQQRLFSEYDVLIYERGGQFNLKALQAIEDVLTRVYGSLFERQNDRCSSLATVKSITAARCADITENPDAPCATEQTVMADALAHNAAITLYDLGMGLTSMDLLSLLTHEFAHSWQFSMDADNEEAQRHLMDNFWKTPGFDAYLVSKQWEFGHKYKVQLENDQSDNEIFVFSDIDVITHDKSGYLYRGYPWLQLIKDLEVAGLHTEYGQGDHASVDRLREVGVLGGYSLSNPWEWHSDAVAAYVLTVIEKHLLKHSKKAIGQRTADRLAQLQRDGWKDEFYYRNLHPQLFQQLSEELPITKADRDALTCRYIVYSDDYMFNTENKNTEEKTPTPGEIVELSQQLRANWADRCASVL